VRRPDIITPLFNAKGDEEWVLAIGRYMLNMGGLELATRLIIVRIEGTDGSPIFSDDLVARIGFIRKRFPRANKARHAWAMRTLAVATRHAGFRNIVAHSPLKITSKRDGSHEINGILNITPKDPKNVGQLVTLEELVGRVNESAVLVKLVLEMQIDFGGAGSALVL
jgi:hypothetical protein